MSQTSAMFNLQAILALIIVPTLTSSLSADTVELISPNPQTNSAFGSAVAAVPDLNGDGLDDFLVSAPSEDILGFTDVGLVRVYSGANGSLIRAHAGPLGLNFTRLGSRLAGIADINQDGRGDYLVAAPNENAPGGRVYVYSGGQGTLIRSHVSPNAEPDGYFGASVASLGDINGDGINDYIIGAVGESNGVTSDAGRVYIYSGANGALIRQHTSPSAQTSGAFGNAVSGIPDVSSDGRDDYIVGAPGESAMFSPPGSGRAHIFDGATGALRHTIGSPNPSQGGGFGFAVAGTLDVFGSGLGDVVVGAPFEPLTIGSTTLAEGGRAYVFSGSSGTVGATLTEPSAQQTAFAAFGMSVATVADMDADGYPEVLIGCPLRDRVYRFNAVDDLFSLHSTYLCPDSIGSSSFGSSIAALRDANADGRGDILIGAPSGDNAPNDPAGSGRAYLYRPVYNDSCG
ncbi:MAG: hypothetical protein RIR10_248, partial [Planctomycetota bacterium]